MTNKIRLAREPRALVKITISVVLVVALFAIINYGRRSLDTVDNGVEDVMKRAGEIHDEEDDSEDTDLTASFPSPWSDSYTNPCYMDGSTLKCFPSIFVLGYQFAGFNILKDAIGLHPKIDAYGTNFFAPFHDMEEVTSNDLQNYISRFDKSAQKINSDSSDLLICDSGRGLARQYALGMRHGAISQPHHTQSSLFSHLYHGAKAVVVTREPSERFYQEFLASGITEQIVEYVNKSIAEFEACLMYADANPDVLYKESCIYDTAFSPLLQAGCYDFLNERDLKLYFGDARVRIYTWEVFKDPILRRDMMADLFQFLGKNTPAADSSYWNNLDALFDSIIPNNEAPIPEVANAMLKSFYEKCASTYAHPTPGRNSPLKPPLRKPINEKKSWLKNIFEKSKNAANSRLKMLVRKPAVKTNPFSRPNVQGKVNRINASLKQKQWKSISEINPFRKVKLRKSRQN